MPLACSLWLVELFVVDLLPLSDIRECHEEIDGLVKEKWGQESLDVSWARRRTWCIRPSWSFNVPRAVAPRKILVELEKRV